MYKQDPSYKPGGAPLVTLEQEMVEEMRRELRADRWNFVQLPWSVLRQELQAVTDVSTSSCSRV